MPNSCHHLPQFGNSQPIQWELSEKRRSNENPIDRYDYKPFVYPSFDLARQPLTLGCKMRIVASTFCLSRTNTSDFHNPDSNLKASYISVRYSTRTMTIIFRVLHSWLRHFLIKCFQSGCITVAVRSVSTRLICPAKSNPSKSGVMLFPGNLFREYVCKQKFMNFESPSASTPMTWILCSGPISIAWLYQFDTISAVSPFLTGLRARI